VPADSNDRDQGSALLLMPVAVLIVIILGAIAVDSSITFLAQRELVDATQAAANDAATYGADVGQIRSGSGYTLDRSRVDEAVRRAFAARGLDRVDLSYEVVGGSLVVHARRRVSTVFSKAIPGGEGSVVVTARATGQARARR